MSSSGSILKQFPGDLSFRVVQREQVMDQVQTWFAQSLNQDLFFHLEHSLGPKSLELVNQRSPVERLDFGVFHQEQFIGYFGGRAGDKGVFHMGMSVLDRAYQGQGIYKKLLDYVLEWAQARGYWAVDSRHQASNNPIICAKLKKGFLIQSLNVDLCAGIFVHLIYPFSSLHRQAMLFRMGAQGPSSELEQLFKDKKKLP